MMIGYELFSVQAWQERGLTIRLEPKRVQQSLTRRRRAWVAAMVLSFTSFGVANFDTSTAMARSNLEWVASSPHAVAGLAPGLADEVPLEYWSKLIARINSWHDLKEPPLAEPEPVI